MPPMTSKIFALPWKIDPSLQKQLIDWQQEHQENPFYVYDYHPYRWTTDFHNIEMESRQNFPRRDRLDPSARWLWSDFPEIHGILEALLAPVIPLYRHFGSVMMHVWKVPNPGLPPHYDCRMHKKDNRPTGSQPPYWRIFIPLSENPHEPSSPPYYVVEGRQLINVSADHHYVMAHDEILLHGVESRPWHRGYITVDGVFYEREWERLVRTPLRISQIRDVDEALGVDVFDRLVKERDLTPGDQDPCQNFLDQVVRAQEERRQQTLLKRSQWQGYRPRFRETQMTWPFATPPAAPNPPKALPSPNP